jgi:hypothetical protein
MSTNRNEQRASQAQLNLFAGSLLLFLPPNRQFSSLTDPVAATTVKNGRSVSSWLTGGHSQSKLKIT